MSFNFPTSPILNQTHTIGNKTWQWDGSAWNLLIINETTIDTTNLLTAWNTGNTAYSVANGAYEQANVAVTLAQDAYDAANSAVGSIDTSARDVANAAYDQANSAVTLAQAAYDQANTANTGGGVSGASESLNVQFDNNNAIQYKLVALNANAETILASALEISQIDRILGILDDTGETVTFGTITNAEWTWTPEQSLYLGANGNIVTTSTVDGGAFSLKIGTAISATQIFVKIGTPVIL